MKTSKIGAIAFLAFLIVVGFSGTSATADERFPEYEKPSEVPVVGSAKPKSARSGPPPARPLVRLATITWKSQTRPHASGVMASAAC